VRVIRASRLFEVSSAPVSLSLARRLGAESPDITHLHSPYPVAEAAWLAVGRRPMVLTYQSDIIRQRWMGRLWAPGLRRVLASADRVLATSPNYAASSPQLRRVADRVAIVPLGIDTGRFSVADRAAGLERFGSGPWVVFVGRLRYYKGLDVLLDAVSLLPGARLLVAGTGPMGAGLRSRAEALALGDRVRWLGDVAEIDLPLLLAAADVFVLPSTARSEAFGLAMVEAMSAGLPVVSTELGTGTSWINRHGETGLVVGAGDAHALAEALGLLLRDESLRRRMGRAARDRAAAEFDAGTMNRRVLDIYREVTT
jgi:rhamnosyl/mannosyltransferase